MSQSPPLDPSSRRKPPGPIRVRQNLGKYKIEKHIAQGGFATVFQALDRIEGVRVALKVPAPEFVNRGLLEIFRREVRLTAQLDHPNILGIKNASYIDDHFVIASPLAERTLADRMQRRISTKLTVDYMDQILDALAHAHARGILHCDIKPENILLFEGNRLRLADFGIAKVAQRTIRASGSGTLGYMAPEQAMGKPSLRSDVFSVGLIFYRLLTGRLPEWPYEWPPAGLEILKRKVPPAMIEFLRKALEPRPRDRFENAGAMRKAFQRLRPRLLRFSTTRIRRKRDRKERTATSRTRDWRKTRQQQFQREFGATLETRHACQECDGPISEEMNGCPWCGTAVDHRAQTARYARECNRCHRGLKADWKYCPHCYGGAQGPASTRTYPDRRYEPRTCANRSCERREVWPFMRYCPWCRTKVRKRWRIPEVKDSCGHCGWGVTRSYWDHCPWCTRSLNGRNR